MSEKMTDNPLGTGIMVGIPFCGRPVMPQWAMSLATVGYPMGTAVQYATLLGQEVGAARNRIVEQALHVGAKYVWFVDDDTAPPFYAIRKLQYALDQNAPPIGKAMVCAGIYCGRSETPQPLVFTERGRGSFWNWKFDDVFDAVRVGTGCMLCLTEVFKKLERPWFRTMDEYVEMSQPVLHMGEDVEAKIACNQTTDDFYFCDKVIDAGYRILAHGGVLPVHWDLRTQKCYALPDDSYPMKPRAASDPVPEGFWNVKPAELKKEQLL